MIAVLLGLTAGLCEGVSALTTWLVASAVDALPAILGVLWAAVFIDQGQRHPR